MLVSYARAAGLLSARTFTLTLLQPGDIVCSALTVHYHKNGKKTDPHPDGNFFLTTLDRKFYATPVPIGGSPYPDTNARLIADRIQEGYRMPKPNCKCFF